MTREHGTPAKYTMEGCKCVLCRKAVSDYAVHRNRLIAYGRWDPYVDAGPVRAHIEQLQAAGIGWKRVARLAGLAPSTVEKILYGAPYRGMGPSKRIRHATADKILSVQVGIEALGGAAVVDATGARRRLQALVAIGWSQSKLASRLGMERSNFGALFERGQMRAETVRAIRDLYDELWSTLPPQEEHRDKIAANRARRYAAERGWAPPMAWDDDTIDDPAAEPSGMDVQGPSRRLPEADELLWLVRMGETDAALAARFGVEEESVRGARVRANRKARTAVSA